MTRITTNWAKFRALPRQEQHTLLAAMVWGPLFWLGLRLLGLRRFQAWLQPGNVTAERTISHDGILRIATLVNIAALHGPFPASCLTRSLMLGWMLRRRGVASKLRIGVRMTQGSLDAHAWVEYAGIPINDRPDVSEQFATFPEIPPLGTFQSS
jgi:hypothetical protein